MTNQAELPDHQSFDRRTLIKSGGSDGRKGRVHRSDRGGTLPPPARPRPRRSTATRAPGPQPQRYPDP